MAIHYKVITINRHTKVYQIVDIVHKKRGYRQEQLVASITATYNSTSSAPALISKKNELDLSNDASIVSGCPVPVATCHVLHLLSSVRMHQLSLLMQCTRFQQSHCSSCHFTCTVYAIIRAYLFLLKCQFLSKSKSYRLKKLSYKIFSNIQL